MTRRIAVDLGFVASLIAIVSGWLVVFRNHSAVHTWPVVLVFAASFAAVLAVWCSFTRTQTSVPEPALKVRILNGDGAWHWVPVLLLAVLAWVSFYQPLKIHFWGGVDDSGALEKVSLWNAFADQNLGRPLNSLFCSLALRLTPDSILGDLWVAWFLCFANSTLLYFIVRMVVPGGSLPAYSAAALLVVNQGDVSRFFVMWTTNYYWSPLFLLLAGIWMLLISQRRQSRGLLVLACCSLGASLLSSEGMFPLALFGPLLLWIMRKDIEVFLIWTFAWLGTMSLLALRLILFLMAKKQSYQARMAEGVMHDPWILVANLREHLRAFWKYFDVPPRLEGIWPWGLFAGGVCALAAWVIVRRCKGGAVSLRASLLGLALGALALLMGVAPFLHIQGLFRTHFFAAPGEALLLGFGIAAVCSLLPPKAGPWITVIFTSMAVSMASTMAFHSQTSARKTAVVYFEKTVHIFEQVHALAPSFSKDALIVFVLDDNIDSPLGPNYALRQLSALILGNVAVQARYFEPLNLDSTLSLGEVGAHINLMRFEEHEGVRTNWEYKDVVAFGLSGDGTVRLLTQLPEDVVPAVSRAGAYDPLACIKPGPVEPLRFLRTPVWADRLCDVLDSSPGMVIGEGWKPLQGGHNKIFREVSNGAEIFINPMGKSKASMTVNVRPMSGGVSWQFEVVDQRNQVVAASAVTKQQTVRLEIPVEAGRINAFRLRLIGKGGVPEDSFRIYCRGKLPVNWHPAMVLPRDIALGGVKLEKGWYPRESFAKDVFRWVSNDAEFVTGAKTKDTVELEVEPGPSLGQSPCRIQLLDEKGRVLDEQQAKARSVVRFSLPTPTESGTRFRLHVASPGVPAPNDPRTLNFRVFWIR